jgi:pyruvate formate lyase activating enzyme
MSEGSIEEDRVLSELEERKAFLDGLVITGGEPTVQPDLPIFMRKVKQKGLKIKLDTNGVHPEIVQSLVRDKLVDFFAMDIKHTFERYPDVVGKIPVKVQENCEKTMRTIARSGVPYEFRTTTDASVHTVEDILAIARHLPVRARYALQGVRRQKTRVPLAKTQEDTSTFLLRCKEAILEERDDIHLIIRI